MEALILIDLQNDFMPGGALPVPEGDEVVPLANQLADQFKLVVASQDWHPRDHRSFASQHPGKHPGDVIELDGLEQRLWPDHCVQNTAGAQFQKDLDLSKVHHVIQKGTDSAIDSYSAFFDNAHRRETGLSGYLKSKGITTVYLMGLATDYCVKFSALDAIEQGFKTYLIGDGCRGIEANTGDVEQAIAAMLRKGVSLLNSRRLLSQPK